MDGRGLRTVRIGNTGLFLRAVVRSVLVRRTCDSIPGDANGKVCRDNIEQYYNVGK